MSHKYKSSRRKKALLFSFAPNHSSALNRVNDCRNGDFDIELYDDGTDKVNISIYKRIFSPKIIKAFAHLIKSDTDVLWCWGLDACIIGSIASVFKPNTRVVWDITDINPHLLKGGLISRALRFVEKILISRAALLLLTSEAFYSQYYAQYIAQKKVLVIENLLPGRPSLDLPPPPDAAPLIITYSGIFRSPSVLTLVRGVAEEMPDQIIFQLHGYPDRTIDPHFFDYIISHRSINYHGRFRPEALPSIYAESHLSWALVDPSANDNERWLLNNRIYNGVSFSRPVVATAGTFSGHLVKARGIGETCELTVAGACQMLRMLLKDNMSEYNKLRKAMPHPETAHLSGEYAKAIQRVLA